MSLRKVFIMSLKRIERIGFAAIVVLGLSARQARPAATAIRLNS